MVLRRRAPAVVGALAALCLSAVACTPSEPSTPSPSPTPSASPTETALERQTRLDFEAAEKAYRTFSAEYDRLANAGGAKEPTQVLKAHRRPDPTWPTPPLACASSKRRWPLEGRVEIGWVQPGRPRLRTS